MASEKLVTEQFQFLGIEVTKEVLVKCVRLCEEYNVDAETLTEQWMAFSLNQLNGAAPTVENLDLLARKEFSKRAVGRPDAPAKDAARVSAGSGLKVYGASASAQPDNDVLSNYVTATPKRPKVEPEATPVQDLGPATYSPSVNHSAKYVARTNQGSVVHSYGDEKLLEVISKPSGPTDIQNINATQVPTDDRELYTKSMFGFELLHEKASIFDNHIRYISQCIMKKAGIQETISVRHKTQSEVYVAGRIECDADARLNPKCVVLQGTWEGSLSQAVPLDIDNVKQYSLFPGQVVVARGTNPRGDSFVVQEIYCDAARSVSDHNADISNTLRGTMSLVIAAGPYTTSDNLSYEPLKDLITYITTHKPHVVFLIGPFLDCDHEKVKDNSIAEPHKAFFDKLVDSLGELNTTCPFTKVYIVASPKDAFHVNISPTPAYPARRKHPNVHLLPDPSTLNINGVVIVLTSTDVLMHIGQEEISLNCGSDKLSRLASHLLSQQCAYPLWPAAAATTAGLAVDAALWAAHAQLPAAPRLLVLPSQLRYFVKEVNGCVVINPERLSKGAGGGTFARLLVSNDADHNAGAGAGAAIAAQILRI